MEDDAIRGDDSWQSFDEVMKLAKTHDVGIVFAPLLALIAKLAVQVDMVLLSGDLFHENKPSRKAMYQVMRSLRMNCYGEKPCSLQIISDTSTAFQGLVSNLPFGLVKS